MTHLSKSKYCSFLQCPKMAWLKKYKPEVEVIDDNTRARMESGNEVGDLARGLFGEFVEVTEKNGDFLDIQKMIERTKEEMSAGTPIICEASFAYEGNYCAVDILKKEGSGWAIYEVKSSSASSDKKSVLDVYIADISYQKYVLERCGVNVTGTFLVRINSDYVFDGHLDLQEFFDITDVAAEVDVEIKNVETKLAMAEKILSSEVEPDVDLSCSCNDPYQCAFWKYCSKHLPSPSVFDLYRLAFKKKISYYKNGQFRYEDLISEPSITNDKQLRQMEFALYDKETFVDKAAIKEFLDGLSYPLYFLDFETIQPVIPEYVGTHPYAQIPFQYSLHYIEFEGGEILHKEFLAESGEDPRRKIAEALCTDIPKDVCVTAYNKSFECGRLKELAEAFPDLAEHLLNIRDNIVDLLDPFQKGYYYNKAMGGSFSIKSVLPAIFPNDPKLDYHNLQGVHNGSEAMSIFPKIQFMTPEDQRVARENLLRYCELDTYAMVKVWEELVRVAK